MSGKIIGLTVLAVVGLVIWIINLARDGDPVGLGLVITFCVVLVLLALSTCVAVIIGGVRRGRSHDEYHQVVKSTTDLGKLVVQLSQKATYSPAAPFQGTSQLPQLPHGSMYGPGDNVVDVEAFQVLNSDQ